MNKSKIEWCDSTWNPVTGCLHNCPYCYADKIANRFSMTNMHKITGLTPQNEVLLEPYIGFAKDGQSKIDPYPFGFSPTFHRYRLGEPARKTKGQKIFVCSMADLFGDWVPDEWIEEVFKACEQAPQHKYMFLTKNPHRYWEMMSCKEFPDNENYWFGNTITKQSDFVWAWAQNHFYSIEPIIQPIDLLEVFDDDSGLRYVDCVKWVIIGAETGNRKNKVIPKREWVENIVGQCNAANVPVFMKNSLMALMGDDFIQEWPEGLR